METIGNIVNQEWIEERYSKKHIDAKIREVITTDADMRSKIAQGIALVQQYMNPAKPYYKSKTARIAQLVNMDISAMVVDLFVGVAYNLRPALFTSVSAQMAARLGFNDKAEAVTTTAELLAVLCQTDAFDIEKEDKMASLMLVSRIPLPESLTRFMENSQYLPPMVCEPLELTHNHSSGYLTHNDSLILGTGNHHDGDICLSVLDTINKVAFKLDLEFLCKVEEEPTFELDSQEKIDNWKNFKKQSYGFYMLMAEQGNQFYFNNKVDKRGRIYACGYHINPQGSSFKKAMLELAHEEVIEGVPT